MKLKRMFCGLLCLVFLVTVMGGCTSKENKKEVKQPPTKETEATTSIVSDPEVFPITAEKKHPYP